MGKGEQAGGEDEWEHHVYVKGSHWAAGTQRGLWRAVYFKKKKKSPLTLQKVGSDHTWRKGDKSISLCIH